MIAYNKIYNYIVIQSLFNTLCILIIFLTTILYFNNNLIVLKYISFNNAVFCNFLSAFLKYIIIVASLLCLIVIQHYIINSRINNIEYSLVILSAAMGLLMLTTSNDNNSQSDFNLIMTKQLIHFIIKSIKDYKPTGDPAIDENFFYTNLCSLRTFTELIPNYYISI